MLDQSRVQQDSMVDVRIHRNSHTIGIEVVSPRAGAWFDEHEELSPERITQGSRGTIYWVPMLDGFLMLAELEAFGLKIKGS
jgi:hypothetical protein